MFYFNCKASFVGEDVWIFNLGYSLTGESTMPVADMMLSSRLLKIKFSNQHARLDQHLNAVQ